MNKLPFYKTHEKFLFSYNSNSRLYIFIILFIFFITVKSRQPYKSYYLEDFSSFLVVYDDRISVYPYSNSNTQSERAFNFNSEEQKINSEDEGKKISLGYIYTVNFKLIYVIVKNYIYYGYDGVIIYSVNINNLNDLPAIVVPYHCIYKIANSCKMCDIYVCFIDSYKKLSIYIYSHGYGISTPEVIYSKTINLVDSSGMTSLSKSDYVSCQIMNYTSYDVLVCFFENEKNEIGAITLNIDTLEQDNLKQPIFKKISGIKDIISITFNNKQKAFICYINDYNNIACIIFDLNSNEFDREYKYIESMTQSKNFFNIDYYQSSDKFILSCYSSLYEFEYLILNDQMNIVDNSFNGGKYCLTNLDMEPCTDNNLPFISLFYDSGILKMVKKCGYQGDFSYTSLSTSCNKDVDREELIINNNDQTETDISTSNFNKTTNEVSESNAISELAERSTINKMTKSSIINVVSAIAKTSTINEMSKSSTIIEMTKSSTINAISELTETSTINEMTKSSTINTISELAKTSTINEMTKSSTIIEMTKSSIINAISELAKTSTINEISKTNAISEMTESSSINAISEITQSSTINEMTKTSTINEMTKSSSINVRTELTQSNAINEMTKSSIINVRNEITESSIINEMTEINTINEKTEINESEKATIKNQIETNKKLDFVVKNLDKLVEEVKNGDIYEVKGEDYLVKVCPINHNQFDNSMTNINFLQCEKTLRDSYKLSSNDYLTEIIIEIKKQNSLTNRVEYSIFHGKNKLNLSLCDNDIIEINYNISNSSLLNLEMISKYAENGIDVLNSKDRFFNDICFPYSENNSDIILKDRLSTIYQNFSKCDDNCDYDKIDLDNLIITCKCSVKNDMTIGENNELEFDTIFLDLFTNSSFGVVKCYSLVFQSGKTDNIGFFIFIILIILHIPLIIHYFLNTIAPINKYIIDEMKKYCYVKNIKNPIKRKHLKEKKNGNNSNCNFINDNLRENNDNQRSKSSFKTNIPLISIRNKKKSNIKNKNNKSKNNLNSSKKKHIKGFKNVMIYNNNNIKRNKYHKKSTKVFLDSEPKNSSKKTKKAKTKNHVINIKEKYNNNINEKKYYLIQINANNSINNKPPDSKIILDNYTYEEAIEFEKRRIGLIFYIILIGKFDILNIFILKSPLELISLRICIIMFIISCDLALNTVFYFNDNISEKYHYNGDNLYLFTILNNFSISLISTFVSILSVVGLKFLTNSKDQVEALFRKEERKMRKDNNYIVSQKRRKEILVTIYEINKKLKVKIIFFFIIEMLIMLFFLYFVTAFCEVYKGTQTSWISDSIISFILSFIIDFIFSFLITIIYIISIRQRCKWLYNIVMFWYHLG